MGANLVEIDATTNEPERFFSRFPCAKSKKPWAQCAMELPSGKR